MEENPSKLVPALIGGCVIGILSSLPYINCLCCMWILLGGVLGTYLYRRELPPEHEFSSGEGAVVGFLSGIFGALFFTFLIYFFWAVGNVSDRHRSGCRIPLGLTRPHSIGGAPRYCAREGARRAGFESGSPICLGTRIT